MTGRAGLNSDCAVAGFFDGGGLGRPHCREGESRPVQVLFRELEGSCRTSSVEDAAGRFSAFSAEGGNYKTKIDISR
jgi:hypothetical protein